MPPKSEAGISTSPISYKPWFEDSDDLSDSLRLDVNTFLSVLKSCTIERWWSKIIHIDIEPEPDCLLENSTDTISFFKDYLIPQGVAFFNKRFQSQTDWKLWSKSYSDLLWCLSFCCRIEDPIKVIKKFQDAGIKIGKVQISSALRVLHRQMPIEKKSLSTIPNLPSQLISTKQLQRIIKESSVNFDLPKHWKFRQWNFTNGAHIITYLFLCHV